MRDMIVFILGFFLLMAIFALFDKGIHVRVNDKQYDFRIELKDK